MTLDAITSVVLQEMLASLEVKATAAEVWETVRSLRISSEIVRNLRPQWLRTRASVSRAALSKFTAAAERLLCKIRSITRTTSIVLREGVQSNRAHA
jgi:hypothetical protein